jgi:voltage-gated potassium channel
LTTVGYGDIYPHTVAGQMLGAVIALMGVALFALPAGILGSGFYEEYHKRRAKDKPVSQSPFQCTSIADEIEKAARLKDNGIITQQEFQDYKNQLLGSARCAETQESRQ